MARSSRESELNRHAEDFDSLYQLYVQASESTKARIIEVTAPGVLRDRLLGLHRTLRKELFEARMTTLAKDPDRYAAVVDTLRGAC
jgi:hypothetical protein